MRYRVVVATSLLAAALAAWLIAFCWARYWSPDPAPLLTVLKRLSPAVFFVGGVGLVFGVCLARHELREATAELESRTWCWLGALLAVVAAVRLALVPATERVYYDEHTYLQLAQGVAEEFHLQVATYGELRDGRYCCHEGSYPHWAAGWPTLLAAAMRLGTGVRNAGPSLNLVLSLAGVVLVALIGRSLSGDAVTAVLAAAVYAVFPANQLWSRTSASEVCAATFAGFVIWLTLRFAIRGSRPGAWLLAAAVAAAAQTRNEMLWIGPLAAAFFAATSERNALHRLLVPAALAALLLLPLAVHLGAVARCYEPHMGQGAGFAWKYASRNLLAAWDYVAAGPETAVALALALAGLTTRSIRRFVLPLSLWAGIAFLLPMFHFGGSYQFPGGERFTLAWLAPVAVLAAAGLRAIPRAWMRPIPRTVWLALGGMLLAAFCWRVGDYAVHRDAETADVRGDCSFLRGALAHVPADAIVVTFDPPAVLAEGRSAVYLPSLFSDASRLATLAAHFPGGLYVYLSPSSNVEQWPGGEACLRWLLETFRGEVVARESDPRGPRLLVRLRWGR